MVLARSHTSFLLLALCALAAIAFWSLWSGEPATGTATAGAPPAEEGAAASPNGTGPTELAEVAAPVASSSAADAEASTAPVRSSVERVAEGGDVRPWTAVVLGADDEPVMGIPVQAVAATTLDALVLPGERGGSSEGLTYLGKSAESDARGRVELTDLVVPTDGRVTILRANVPGSVVPYVEVPSAEPTVEPLVIRLPPTARVVVTPLRSDGSEFPPGGDASTYEVRLTLVHPDEALQPDLAFERPFWSRVSVGEPVTFPGVLAGSVVEAWIQRTGTDVSSTSEPVGPLRAGEVAQLSVQLGADTPVLRYRAVDEGGTPLAHEALALRLYSWFGGSDDVEVTTDELGRFTIEVDRIEFIGGTLAVTTRSRGDEVLRGSARYSGQRETGLHDAGDVVLRVDGFVAAGVVVDGGGSPVEGASVSAGLEARYEDEGWMQEAPEHATTTSGADGRFEIRGPRVSEEVQVWAESGGTRSEPVQATLGARDLRLELRARCRVSGLLLLDEGAEGKVELKLLQEEREIAGTEMASSDGGFTMAPVDPGTYALVARLGSEVVFEIEELILEGDHSVGTIDLRGQLTRQEVRVVAPDADVLAGRLWWRVSGADDDDGWKEERIEDSHAVFWSASPEVDVQVVVPRYRFVELLGMSGTEEVHLLAPLRVRVIVDTEAPFPKPPYVFDPEVRDEHGRHVGTADGSPFLSDANREVTFLVSKPGTLKVAWHLERRAENMAVGGGVLHEHEVEIEVLDAAGEQVVRVPLDAGALRRLVESPPF